MKISPNTPEIPAIYPSEYRVCGKVIPSTVPQTRHVEIRPTANLDQVIEVAANRETGLFCQFLKPGTYSVNVKISDFEKSKGLQ